jgi:hypothetical protein
MNMNVLSQQLVVCIKEVFSQRDGMPIRYLNTNLRNEQVLENLRELANMIENNLEANIHICDPNKKEIVLYYNNYYIKIRFNEDYYEEVEFKISVYLDNNLN